MSAMNWDAEATLNTSNQTLIGEKKQLTLGILPRAERADSNGNFNVCHECEQNFSTVDLTRSRREKSSSSLLFVVLKYSCILNPLKSFKERESTVQPSAVHVISNGWSRAPTASQPTFNSQPKSFNFLLDRRGGVMLLDTPPHTDIFKSHRPPLFLHVI